MRLVRRQRWDGSTEWDLNFGLLAWLVGAAAVCAAAVVAWRG